MRIASALRYASAALVLCGAAFVALGGGATPAEGQSAVPQDGKLGFVVSDIGYIFSHEASETGACPNGMSLTAAQIYAQTQEGRRGADESDQDYLRRLSRNGGAQFFNASGQSPCLNPTGEPDPGYRTVTGANVQVLDGIDLDGQNSRANGRAAAGTCAHDDFRTVGGGRGVDNQFFRAMGCVQSYQPSGQGFSFKDYMLSGAWGILITLSGVDDVRNDDSVEVGVSANGDPIQLSPNRTPLENATYSMDQDPRFRSTVRGRIVNGVITTEPVDMRFHVTSNGMFLERHVRDARLRLTLGADGAMDGVLAGYMPVQEVYDMEFGYRTAQTASGELAPQILRTQTALGRSYLLSYSCQGVYHALVSLADGHRDPQTGQCTSISVQYRLRAIPAFVVDVATRSVNADLQE